MNSGRFPDSSLAGTRTDTSGAPEACWEPGTERSLATLGTGWELRLVGDSVPGSLFPVLFVTEAVIRIVRALKLSSASGPTIPRVDRGISRRCDARSARRSP